VGHPLHQRLEPLVGPGLEMTDEFLQTQFPLLFVPARGPQWGTQGKGQYDEQHPSVESTQGAVPRRRGERGEMEVTFPGCEHQFALPSSRVGDTDGLRRPHRGGDVGNKKVPGQAGERRLRGGEPFFFAAARAWRRRALTTASGMRTAMRRAATCARAPSRTDFSRRACGS